MTESDDLNPSIDMGASKARDPGSAVTKLWIWILEIVAEALGTCLIIIAFAFLQFRHEEPPLSNDLSVYKVFGISAFVLFEFAMTGYLVTTLVSRFALRGKVQPLYPCVCAALYLIHSTIFFVGVGNPVLRKEDLIIQLCGALVALTCTWGGNRLLAHKFNGTQLEQR